MQVYAVKVIGQETGGLRDGGRHVKQPGYDIFSSLLTTIWHLDQSL